LSAAIFAVIETLFKFINKRDRLNKIFTRIFYNKDDDSVIHCEIPLLFYSRLKNNFTDEIEFSSFRQFILISLLWPFFTNGYRSLISNSLIHNDFIIRIIVYPIYIWIFEIFLGYIIIFLFGYNVAWDYSDEKWNKNFPHYKNAYRTGKDVFFHGNIKLFYVFYWWLLGILHESLHNTGIYLISSFF